MRWTSLIRRRAERSPWWDTATIVLGCLLMALGFRLFLNANRIVAGGVVGLSTILERAFGWEPALVQWGANIVLLLLALRALGKSAGLRSLLGSALLPLVILLTRNLPPITDNPLLAALFGGVCYGGGLGLVLSGGGSVGGYSLLARMAARVLPVSIPTTLFLLDAATLLAGAGVFGPERALYGLISVYTMRRALDATLLGFSRAKVALVISERHEPIKTAVLTVMDRGLTVLSGVGGYTDTPRPVLLVVLGQAEVPALRRLVRELDPDAFVVLTDAAEVQGKGFHADA